MGHFITNIFLNIWFTKLNCGVNFRASSKKKKCQMSNTPVTHRILYRLGIYRYHSNTFQNFKYKKFTYIFF